MAQTVRPSILAVLAASVFLGGPSPAFAAAPGWSSGGDPYNARSQVDADRKHAKRECAANSALLFRVRGSSEVTDDPNPKKQDRLRRWSSDASAILIRNGWNVRQMSADYRAPNVPLAELAIAVLRRNPVSLAKAALSFKSYRDVIGEDAPKVRRQLIDAARRCEQRQILVAGYSLGNIMLREIFNGLPRDVRSQVVSVDLVSDPTADKRVDKHLSHRPGGPPLYARLTGAGVDTAFNAARPAFRQRAYDLSRPKGRRALRITQYCVPADIVCEVGRESLKSVAATMAIHSSYDFGSIGDRAANDLGVAPGFVRAPSGGGDAPSSPGSPAEPPAPAPPPSAPPQPVPAPAAAPARHRTWPAHQGSRGVNTFLNPYNASGMGPRIEPYQWVEVFCKVYAPQIVSANPDGYWYRIASSPWNGSYYSPANTFWNGDVPGQRPYTHNTDFSIPDC